MTARPSPTIAQVAVLAPMKCGICAAKIRMASALTKPVRTEVETKRISTPRRSRPNTICIAPASTPAASRYCSPCACTSGAATSATEPAAADTIAGRPPVKAMTMLITNDANSPTAGSTPATKEKAMTSGMSANVATAPAISSRGMLGHHSVRRRLWEEDMERGKRPACAGEAMRNRGREERQALQPRVSPWSEPQRVTAQSSRRRRPRAAGLPAANGKAGHPRTHGARL
ncbi:hypothetical protein QF040_004562 [Variovorax sp. W2I14]